jgi:outer membrane immunogenic protein
MRKYVLAATALTAALFATPASARDAAAPFSGARVGVTVSTGGNNVVDFDGATIGVDAGYDWDLGTTVVGLGADYETDLGNDFFDANQTSLTARFGAKIGKKALVYATGGYSRVSSGATPFGNAHADGFRVGGGAEFALGNGGTALKIEERYSNYGHGVDLFQTVAGLSFRF